MKRIAILAATAVLLSGCAGASTVEVGSANDWCTQYDALVTANLAEARQWFEDPTSLSVEDAEAVRVALLAEQALAQAAADNGYLQAELADVRIRLGDEAANPAVDRFVEGVSQGGPLGAAIAAKAYATLMSDAERVAREAGFDSAEDAVDAYAADIDATCGFNPIDRVNEDPVA